VRLVLPGGDFGGHLGRLVTPGAAHRAGDGGNLGVARPLLGAGGGVVALKSLNDYAGLRRETRRVDQNWRTLMFRVWMR
jgi:hypothetical protein